MTKPDREAAGFWDASLWETARRRGDAAIKAMIDDGLRNTSVTCVLIGAETATRKWVKYEIEQSLERGNGLLGVYINGLRDRTGLTDPRGANPLDDMYTRNAAGLTVSLSVLFSTYDYTLNDGYGNLGRWIEEAARK